jgi:hypothetical protein
LVQSGVSEIPKAHINKRWTTSARDILPMGFKAYEQENLCLDSMTFRHSYLYLSAISVIEDGNKDLGAFEIVSKELKQIQIKLKSYFSSKANVSEAGCSMQSLVQHNYYTSVSEEGVNTETERDGETAFENEREGNVCNTYGAAGSSAEMSDSDLMRIRAPTFIRPPGRPRVKRLKGALDYFGVRKAKKGRCRSISKNIEEVNNDEGVGNKTKRKIRCRTCKILGHTSAQCKKKVVDIELDIPEV